jgi:hypothetical protein
MAGDVTLLPTVGSEGSLSEALDNLGKDVYEGTGGNVYGAGQPATEDNEAEVEAKADEKGKSETTSTEALIAGKWKTDEEARNGVHELTHYAKNALERADQATAAKAEMEAKLNTLIQVLGGAKKDETPPDALAELESLAAIPQAQFAKAVDILIERKFENIMKPVNDRRNADAEMLKIAPEYGDRVPEIIEFLNKNPDVKAEVEYAESKGEYLLARKFAWKVFDATQKSVTSTEVAKKRDSRIEKIKDALPDAGIVGASRADERINNDAPSSESDWPSQERMQYLQRKAREGHADILWRETIGKMLDKQGFPG